MSGSVSSGFQVVATGLAGGATVTVPNLASSEWYYKLTAVNAVGSTDGAICSTILWPPIPTPGPPGFSNINSVGFTVILPTNVGSSFTLQQLVGGVWTDIQASLPTDATVNISGQNPGASYTYRALETFPARQSSPGPSATVTTFPDVPATPVTVASTSTSLTLGTAAANATTPALPAGATSLTLQMCSFINSAGWSTVATNLGADGGCQMTQLVPSGLYYLRYLAVGPSGSTPGSQVLVQLPAGTYAGPGTPGFVIVTPTSVIVTCVQQPFYDNPGPWTLQQSLDNIAFSVVGNCDFAGNATAAGLLPGTLYYYRWVDPTVANNPLTGPVASVTTAPATPAAPTVTSTLPDTLHVVVPGAAAGVLCYSIDQAGWNQVNPHNIANNVAPGGNVDVNVPADSGPAAAFRVTAVGPNASTTGPFTGLVPSLYPAPPTPPAPTVTSTTSTTIGIVGPAVPPHFGLQYKQSSSSTWNYSFVWGLNIGDPSGTQSGLTPSTSYDFRFLATNGDNIAFPGPVTTVSTASLIGTPPAPAIAAYATSADATVPTLPVGAASLNLMVEPASSGAWTVAVAGATGAVVTDSNLVPGMTYEFQWVAVGNNGQVPGSVTTVTLPSGAPPVPGTPVFSNLTDSSVVVSTPAFSALPGLTLSLQQKLTGSPDASFITAVDNVPSSASIEVDGLVPGTAYTFRFVLTDPGGATPGAVGTLTTAVPTIVWSAGQGISCAGIRTPGPGNTVSGGTTVRLTAGLATDWDTVTRTVNGLAFRKDVSDPCRYIWQCNGGTFVAGGSGGFNNSVTPPTANGAVAIWRAPTTPGTYTLTLTVTDQSQGGNMVPGAFNNNQPAADAGSRADPVRSYLSEPLHYSVTVTVGP